MGEKDLPAVIVIGAQNSGPVRVQVLEEQLGRRGDAVAPLRPVLLRTLADVQERLTFRAQAFIKARPLNPTPKPPDACPSLPSTSNSAGLAPAKHRHSSGSEVQTPPH